MSHKQYKGFEPKWVNTPAPSNSYRSIFRWGDPEFFKFPKESLYKMMKEVFKLTDDDFREYSDDIGFDPVDLSDHPVKLAQEHLDALKQIVGEEGLLLHTVLPHMISSACATRSSTRYPTLYCTLTRPSRSRKLLRTRPSTIYPCTSTAAEAP